MAYLFVRLLIHWILFWPAINGAVLNCTVYSTILQQVPNRIVGTIAIANSSNNEIFWNYVYFDEGAQFPLRFIVVIPNPTFVSDTYIIQLHIYKLPRDMYDLPMWSADSTDPLKQDEKSNFIPFHAYSDYVPLNPCLLGIIINAQQQQQSFNLAGGQLIVRFGSMPLITYALNSLTSYFPLLFMITDVPESEFQNSTQVTVLISNPRNIFAFEGRGKVVFNNDWKCSTIVIRASQEKTTNLTVTMSAHVFTSVPLFKLAATYRIYDEDYLLYERSSLIDTIEFPFRTPSQLVPITRTSEYVIEANIFGPVAGFSSSVMLFQGVTKARLIPGVTKNVQISMLYIGPKIGTTIIGTIRQIPSNASSWPLAGSNLAIVLNTQVTDLSESVQFTIFDQTFPLEFAMLSTRKITANNQNAVFIVTITYLDGTVIWQAMTESHQIVFDNLNRLDIGVFIADGYSCQVKGGGYCSTSSTFNVNQTCCSQFKCASGQCKLP